MYLDILNFNLLFLLLLFSLFLSHTLPFLILSSSLSHFSFFSFSYNSTPSHSFFSVFSFPIDGVDYVWTQLNTNSKNNTDILDVTSPYFFDLLKSPKGEWVYVYIKYCFIFNEDNERGIVNKIYFYLSTAALSISPYSILRIPISTREKGHKKTRESGGEGGEIKQLEINE
jgi:hypothetical protein